MELYDALVCRWPPTAILFLNLVDYKFVSVLLKFHNKSLKRNLSTMIEPTLKQQDTKVSFDVATETHICFNCFTKSTS